MRWFESSRPCQTHSIPPRSLAPAGAQRKRVRWGEEEQTERSEACTKGGIHEVQFVLTMTR